MGDLESNDNLSSLSRSSMLSSFSRISGDAEQELEVCSPSPTKNSILQLIPEYIMPHCKRPISVELRMSYDGPTDQISYTYSITWEGSEEAVGKLKTLLTKKASKACLAPPAPIFVPVVCDGPCGKTYGSEIMYTVAACKHRLCGKCVVVKTDGAPGCSSKQCCKLDNSVQMSKASFEKSSSLEPIFKIVYPSTEEIVGVKLVIVEPSEQYRMTHCSSFVELEMVSSTKMLKAVRQLLVRKKKRDPDDFIRRGTLYFVQLKENWKRRIRRVPKEGQDLLALYDFPQVAEHIVFVLDMGDFVKNGNRIYFE